MRFVESAADMRASAVAYFPPGMERYIDDLKRLPEALELIAEAFKITAQRAPDEFPLDPRIGEALAAIHGGIVAARSASEGIGELAEKMHEKDLERLRNPRRNEQLWDYRANRGGS